MKIKDFIDATPAWQNASDIFYEPISNGYSNKIFKVTVEQDAFVLRINGSQNIYLGLDYADEAQVMDLAAAHDISPQVLSGERTDCLITHFLDGDTLDVAQMQDAETIRIVTGLLQKVHALPYSGNRTSTPFSLIRGYLAGVKQLGLECPPELNKHLQQISVIEEKRQADPGYLQHYCHNDMFYHNIFHCTEGSYKLLDWELSGLGDIWFDLATISFSCGFDEDKDKLLLTSYFGQVDGSHKAILQDMKRVCMVREIGWALLHTAINRKAAGPGRDYMDFALSVLDRLQQGILTLV